MDHTNPPASDKGDHPPHDIQTSNGSRQRRGRRLLRYMMYAGIY
ncbi:hypothetical protein ACEQPO_06295 [Bacillus sp. SL00103]